MNHSTLLLRRTGIHLFDALGINRLLQRRFAGLGVALMLHRVVERPSDTVFPGMAIDVPFLGEALREFLRLGFEFVRASEVIARLQAPRDTPFVCVTLDDGYRDNLHVALPLFREVGVPFTVYPTVGFMQDDGSAPDEARTVPPDEVNVAMAVLEHLFKARQQLIVGKQSLPLRSPSERRHAERAVLDHVHQLPMSRVLAIEELMADNGGSLRGALGEAYMTWTELRTLASDPLVEIGGHGLTHRRFSSLTAEEARSEIVRPRDIFMQTLDVPVRSIAFPFGGPDAAGPREFRLAEEAGYDVGFTTVRANLHREHAGTLLRLPRLGLSLAPHGRSLAFVRGIARGGQHAVLNRFRRFVV